MDKETVFEESKKYSSRSEFKKKKSGAFRIAYMNGWLDLSLIHIFEGLREAIPNHKGDWYFTGHYPTPGGTKLCNQSFVNYIENVYHK